MMKVWKKKNQEEIKKIVFGALDQNINYHEAKVLGIPASFLDDKVFNQDASFIKDAPFISTLIQNPNHIGCHTLGSSESFFKGTQQIEKELIEICAVDILNAEENSIDGYVAAGGTEANLQAVWIYRNYFMDRGADLSEIAILCSEDSHYSMDKAGNVFVLDVYKTEVEHSTRLITEQSVQQTIDKAKSDGKTKFIVLNNMMTTMFGSVDPIQVYVDALENSQVDYKIHIDGAFGGFYYPFSCESSELTFENPNINSFTLDAHKMAQAPYGTGIFLIRKDFIQYANTREASYVEGEDYTLSGSRSGANAVASWMILVKNGPYGWKEKVFILQKRTNWMCDKLDELGIEHYRHSDSNIITIASSSISEEIAKEFMLVPDNHKNPKWYKMVIMEHVTIEKLMPLLDRVKGHVTK